MSLRFFSDHCVPATVARTLRAAGHTVFELREHLPRSSPDPEVIAKAQDLDAILVSVNGDFSDIVAYPPRSYGGIIGLQVKNHPEVIPQILSRLGDYLVSHPGQDHYRGKLLLVEPHRIRIRYSLSG